MRGRNKGSLWSDAFITCRDLARRRRRSASPTRPAAYGARVKPATPRPLHSEPPGGKRSRGARGTASEALDRSAGGGALSTRRAETPSELRGSVRPRGKSPFPPGRKGPRSPPRPGVVSGSLETPRQEVRAGHDAGRWATQQRPRPGQPWGGGVHVREARERLCLSARAMWCFSCWSEEEISQ